MIFHYTRPHETQIWPISSICLAFFQANFTFFIVFSTFYPLDGFLAPWDPSQKKDLEILRRMVPLRPLYDEIWPDSGQFKVPNFTFLPSRPNMTKESPPEIREGSFYLAFTTWSSLPEFPVVMLSSLVLGKRTKGWPPYFCQNRSKPFEPNSQVV